MSEPIKPEFFITWYDERGELKSHDYEAKHVYLIDLQEIQRNGFGAYVVSHGPIVRVDSEPIDDGGRAFPGQMETGFDARSGNFHEGMSLRDYFAAAALTGLVAQSNGTAMSSELSLGAKWAYAMADLMLEARKQ